MRLYLWAFFLINVTGVSVIGLDKHAEAVSKLPHTSFVDLKKSVIL